MISSYVVCCVCLPAGRRDAYRVKALLFLHPNSLSYGEREKGEGMCNRRYEKGMVKDDD